MTVAIVRGVLLGLMALTGTWLAMEIRNYFKNKRDVRLREIDVGRQEIRLSDEKLSDDDLIKHAIERDERDANSPTFKKQ